MLILCTFQPPAKLLLSACVLRKESATSEAMRASIRAGSLTYVLIQSAILAFKLDDGIFFQLWGMQRLQDAFVARSRPAHGDLNGLEQRAVESVRS